MIVQPDIKPDRVGFLMDNFAARDEYVQAYSWAIPSEPALAVLAELAPLVEIGAGGGYWASLLRARGVKIEAYDRPRKEQAIPQQRHTLVCKGGPEVLLQPKYASYTLFLCWPPYNNTLAADCLRNFRGHTVAYVGEGGFGCTGDATFHAMLVDNWRRIKVVRIPHWPWVHDDLRIYRRKIKVLPNRKAEDQKIGDG